MTSTQGTTASRGGSGRAIVPAHGWASHLSARSWIVAGAGLTASLGVYAGQILLSRLGSQAGAVAFSDIGEAVVVGWAAAMIVWLALALPDREVLRDQWLMIGASTAAFFVGDALWAWLEVGTGVQPASPGWPDAFYAVSYLMFGMAIVYAAITYAHGVNLRIPTWLAAGAGLVLSVVAVPLAVNPITSSGAPVAEQATSLAYIFGDVWLQIVPALFIVLVVQRTGRQTAALTWVAVAAAAGIMGISDGVFGVVAAHGGYAPGSIADLGWMIGHVLLAVAASMAVDAHAGDTLLAEAGTSQAR